MAINVTMTLAVCQHGLSYDLIRMSTMHPHRKGDLFREQIEACHCCDIRALLSARSPAGGASEPAAGVASDWQG